MNELPPLEHLILVDDGAEQIFAAPDPCGFIHFGIQGSYGYSSLVLTRQNWIEMKAKVEKIFQELPPQ